MIFTTTKMMTTMMTMVVVDGFLLFTFGLAVVGNFGSLVVAVDLIILAVAWPRLFPGRVSPRYCPKSRGDPIWAGSSEGGGSSGGWGGHISHCSPDNPFLQVSCPLYSRLNPQLNIRLFLQGQTETPLWLASGEVSTSLLILGGSERLGEAGAH